MNILAYKECSRQDLYSKLCKRYGEYHELVPDVIDVLIRDGLQSDLRFAGVVVRSRAHRGQGLQRIVYELKNKGIESHIIDEALAEESVDWLELAGAVLRKRFGLVPPEDNKDKAKRMRFLQQRGFGSEEIYAAIKAM